MKSKIAFIILASLFVVGVYYISTTSFFLITFWSAIKLLAYILISLILAFYAGKWSHNKY